MAEEEIAIRVENVSKDFLLPHEKVSSIKGAFTGLTKGRNRTKEVQHALKDISFEIKKGEFFGIVGRNGSGKSTLLKILAGIYQPTSGKTYTQGKLVPFIELGVGFNPELTGRENVFLNGAMLGFSEKEVAAMYDEIVEFAELEKFMDQKLKNYSSGMQVRLAFSMAVRAKADIMLIDEVLAVGDADFQRKCYDYFQRVKAQDVTVVFVTHDMGSVRQFCDRVAVIDDSKLLDVTGPEVAAKEYMRLFTESKEGLQDQREERWGNEAALFKQVSAKPEGDRHILINAVVEAKNDIVDPTYGFMISNEAKQSILGSNTVIEQVKIEPLRKGRKIAIQWKIPNIFNEGRYQVEVVLMYNTVTQVADWWENAASFSVRNDKRTPYIVNPPLEFKSE